MAKTAGTKNDVIVLARTGYGMDWTPAYHVNADNNKDEKDPDKWSVFVSLDAAKAQAIDYIRKHRAGGQQMEYRIKDLVSGAILD